MKRLVKLLQMVRRGFGGLGSFGAGLLGRSGQAGVCPCLMGAGFVRPAGPGQGARSARGACAATPQAPLRRGWRAPMMAARAWAGRDGNGGGAAAAAGGG